MPLYAIASRLPYQVVTPFAIILMQLIIIPGFIIFIKVIKSDLSGQKPRQPGCTKGSVTAGTGKRYKQAKNIYTIFKGY